MKSHRFQTARRGLSLVEVLVGLVLGMLVSAALLLLFANASSKSLNVQRSSTQVENGRFVAELLRDDLQLAGFWGETPTEGAAWSTPDPCATSPTGFSAAPLTLPTAVRGYGAADALGCLTTRNRLAGTDALVVRRVDVVTTNPAALPGGNKQYHLQSSYCAEDPSATPLVFERNPAQMTLRNRACGAANVARPYISRIYFIASCNDCAGAGDGMPTLKRLDLVGDNLLETALVDGVQAFAIEYGFDTNNDGSADEYRTSPAAAGAASLWQNVVALKLHYITRSLERVSGANTAAVQRFTLGGTGDVATADDGYVRRAYSITVRLINPSGSRENP
jgi:type IV pilus assembly protein PilW